MTIDTLQEKYAALRTEACRMASAFSALQYVIKHDPDIALDLCRMFENYACGVLDAHPRHQDGGEA